MIVLWLCNVATPDIARKIGIGEPSSGGWIQGTAAALSEKGDVQLYICFPQNRSRQLLEGETDKVRFFGFPASGKPAHVYDDNTEKWLKEILQKATPDVVHIWGTEFPQALAMTRAYANPARTIVHIQGLCEFIAQHYCAHLPDKVCYTWTIRDFLRHDRIADQQKKFRLRGDLEKLALRNSGFVIGRTSWDRACVRQVAPNATYRVCNETLRNVFYENAGAWSADLCEKHSIFVSQASYPLKGFHFVLEAMPEILRRYPDAKLYTTGTDPFKVPFHRVNGYQQWLKRRILELELKKRVFFLGHLGAQAMCQRFLKSHVFVSASSIENSPNSVGEAMLLGVPTVASYVGGTMDLLRDRVDGFLYPSDASYMIADRVCTLFGDQMLSERMSRCATEHALVNHDPKKNLACLQSIYREVCEV